MAKRGLVICGFIGLVLAFAFCGGFMLFCRTVFNYADNSGAIGSFATKEEVSGAKFVPYRDYGAMAGNDVRLIALYLPQ